MPTAAAVAAAAATAKIQAMDAVATNAVLGLSAAAPSLGLPAPSVIPSLPGIQSTITASSAVSSIIPPPGIAIPQVYKIIFLNFLYILYKKKILATSNRNTCTWTSD